MPSLDPLSQTQVIALVAAFACVLALLAAVVHDRSMTQRSQSGEPWLKPAYPLAILAMATILSVMTAVLSLQGR